MSENFKKNVCSKQIKRNLRDLVKTFKILSNPYRLLIIQSLAEGKKKSGVIADEINQDYTAASNNLMRMQREGVLDSKYEGKEVYYWIKDKRLIDACHAFITSS